MLLAPGHSMAWAPGAIGLSRAINSGMQRMMGSSPRDGSRWIGPERAWAGSCGASGAPGLAPGGKVGAAFFVGGRVQAEDGTALEHHFLHEVFEDRHLGGFGGEVVGPMGRKDDHAFRVADDHVAGKHRRIAAAYGPVDVYGLVQRQIGWRARALVVGREGQPGDVGAVAQTPLRRSPPRRRRAASAA